MRRESKGWSQAHLADLVGVHANIIKKIEGDRGEGEQPTRQAIADALGCTMADLYRDPQAQPQAATIGGMTPFEFEKFMQENIAPRASLAERKLIRLFRSLSSDDRTSVLTLAESLAAGKDKKLAPRRSRL